MALKTLNARELDPATVDATLGVVLKYQDDIVRVRGDVAAKGVVSAKKAAE